ncbi:MAG: carbohydrate kinase [Bacteroidales bacterium]|nr:carbohydrate kinase [Bacteroidales bacterium]
MKKVIGIGETILDILFKDNQPMKAVPGGSVFNSIISLGRMGADAVLVSEVGNDRVGDIVVDSLVDSGVDASHIYRYDDAKSPVSLAFLDKNNDAEYIFHKGAPTTHLDIEFPKIEAGDIVIYGSYFVLNPLLRNRVKAFLEYARNCGAILYYDVNFRKNHAAEKLKLSEALIENLEYADVVRGSIDDFNVLYGMNDAACVYKEKIKFYSSNFICTHGGEGVKLFTRDFIADYAVPAVKVVSSVGAGDNFNAGVVYGLLSSGVTREELLNLSLDGWDAIIKCGIDFSAHACTLMDNYIEKSWAEAYKKLK